MSWLSFNGIKHRSRVAREQEVHGEPDQWLIEAAREAGHPIPAGERPAGTSAWRVLLSAGIADSEVLHIACAVSGADAADFGRLSPSLASSLPHNLALAHRVVPVGVHGGTLNVATSNPRNPALERELAFAAKQRVRLQAAGPADIIRAQGMVYGSMFDSLGDGTSLTLGGPAPDAPLPPIMQPRPAPVARMSLAMLAPVESADTIGGPDGAMPDSGALEVETDDLRLVARPELAVYEHAVDELAVDEPAVDDPTADELTADEPTADEPAVDEHAVDEPDAAADEPPDGADGVELPWIASAPEESDTLASHETVADVMEAAPVEQAPLDEVPPAPKITTPVHAAAPVIAPRTVAPPAPVRASAPEPAPAPEAAPAAAAPPSPDLSERLLATAVAGGAAEAVLEPEADGALLVRFSIDGTFTDRFRIPVAHVARLVAALKRRAALDPVSSTRAQQGRFVIDAADGPVHVRVTTVPITSDRERVLLRFRTLHDLLDLSGLGFTRDELHRVQSMLVLGAGLVVVAGPDGAGRTTTLYAASRELHRELRLDRTIEELIEMPVPGITQMELRDSPHPTIASAIRSLLATDGDGLVVCAPLDALTLAACDPELGGRRLVVAPLAAADAAATVTRLRKLHLDRDRLADTLAGVIAQRLLRTLCDACAVQQAPDDLPEQQRYLVDGLPMSAMRRPVGCEACRGTGYRGRTAIVEVMAITRELRDAIARDVPEAELAALARERGMPTLWDSGLHRVLQGVTSLAELLDVVPPPAASGGGAPQEDIDALLSQLLGSPLVPAKPRKPAPARRERAAPISPAPDTHAPAAEPPLAPAAAARAEVALPPAAPSPAAEREAPSRTVRVLLVDDDAGARRQLARVLTEAGLQVLQAADGPAALAYARRLQPDVVLTEIALPGLDAIGLLGALAGEPHAPPVIVLADQADDAMDAWLAEAGAVAVVRRDVPVGELTRRLIDAARRD